MISIVADLISIKSRRFPARTSFIYTKIFWSRIIPDLQKSESRWADPTFFSRNLSSQAFLNEERSDKSVKNWQFFLQFWRSCSRHLVCVWQSNFSSVTSTYQCCLYKVIEEKPNRKLLSAKMNDSFSRKQFCLLFPYNVKIRIKIIERWKHT